MIYVFIVCLCILNIAICFIPDGVDSKADTPYTGSMRKQLYPAETVLIHRECRESATQVQLVYNYEADPTQPWETICVHQGGVCSHETRALAESFLSHPSEWCEDCMYGEGTLAGRSS